MKPASQKSRKKLPSRVELPSRRVFTLRIREEAAPESLPQKRAERAPLFSELFALEECGVVSLSIEKEKVACEDLPLADFHALRALLIAGGLIEEEIAEFSCRNCDAAISVRPCDALPLGPFRDAELFDEELDVTLPFAQEHEIEPIRIGDRKVTCVVFLPRTAKEAAPLFLALARNRLQISAKIVSALGIERLGGERDAARIARALRECSDDAFDSVTRVWLASHYPARLGAVVMCESCGARNDVDAPYEREFEPYGDIGGRSAPEDTGAFPSFDEFSDAAHASFTKHAGVAAEDAVDLVIDDGTPACDDGGEPLLGSYMPEVKGDGATPALRPTVTLYLKTFRAMWNEEGPYDVTAEIDETVSHELEHHGHFLSGHDPMDEEERREIAVEAARVHGKKELAREAARGLGFDIAEFAKRTWPIWLVVLFALIYGFFFA